MQLLERSGVGTISVDREIYDSTGTGMLPLQAAVTSGVASFRVMARVDPGAPWMEIAGESSSGWLNSIAWVPFIQLEIVSGTGTVRLWLGEK